MVLVDDDGLVLRVLAAKIEAEPDLDVVGTAMTIEDAMRLTAATSPDVVVIDYWLPDGDGATGTRQLRQATPGLRVVMLSGRADDTARAEALDAGCCDFVAKGANLDLLARTIRAAAVGADGAVRDDLSP